MSTSYDAMWEKLNLDLEAHAGLLQVLGKFYGDIYMSQQGRLRGHGVSRFRALRSPRAQDKGASGCKGGGQERSSGPSASLSPKK